MKQIVLKLGTGILSAGAGEIHHRRLHNLAEGIVSLREENVEVIVVSSGAVGLGMGKLGLSSRPSDLSILRACASIGQCLLMNAWSEALNKVGLVPAQVLLTGMILTKEADLRKLRKPLRLC